MTFNLLLDKQIQSRGIKGSGVTAAPSLSPTDSEVMDEKAGTALSLVYDKLLQLSLLLSLDWIQNQSNLNWLFTALLTLLTFHPFSEQHLTTPLLCLFTSSCLPLISHNIEYRKSTSQRPGTYFKFRTMSVTELCSRESLFFNMF